MVVSPGIPDQSKPSLGPKTPHTSQNDRISKAIIRHRYEKKQSQPRNTTTHTRQQIQCLSTPKAAGGISLYQSNTGRTKNLVFEHLKKSSGVLSCKSKQAESAAKAYTSFQLSRNTSGVDKLVNTNRHDSVHTANPPNLSMSMNKNQTTFKGGHHDVLKDQSFLIPLFNVQRDIIGQTQPVQTPDKATLDSQMKVPPLVGSSSKTPAAQSNKG